MLSAVALLAVHPSVESVPWREVHDMCEGILPVNMVETLQIE